jgi:STE24 endopeptidase
MVVQLTLLMILFLLVNFADWFLELLNYRYLKKHDSDIPEEFEDWIDLDKLKETMNYTTEKFRFNLVSSVFDELLIPVFIFSGLLNLYNSWVSGFNFSFILGGLIFFLILSYLKAVIDIPFNLFSTFKIENKYGFNTMSLKLWIKDFLISLILSSILMGIIIGVSLLLI